MKRKIGKKLGLSPDEIQLWTAKRTQEQKLGGDDEVWMREKVMEVGEGEVGYWFDDGDVVIVDPINRSTWKRVFISTQNSFYKRDQIISANPTTRHLALDQSSAELHPADAKEKHRSPLACLAVADAGLDAKRTDLSLY